ncbi:Phage integrase, N-terminal SAM-like domain [Pseudacidovorax sp. RU35E]|nr:Phage integrase, N-terminal SAM-like domain [Pseudacidovorax sp. RU35E]
MGSTHDARCASRYGLSEIPARGPNLDLPPLRATRVLDLLRGRLRLMQPSLRTEETYVCWVKAFIRFHRLRHPAEMGGTEVIRRSMQRALPSMNKGPAMPGLIVGACQSRQGRPP